ASHRQGTGTGAAGPGVADRHAHGGFADVEPLVGPLGDRLDCLLGLGAAFAVAGHRATAAGGLDQHIEGVLDQGGVTGVGAGDRAGGGVGQVDEFRRAAQMGSSSAVSVSKPARLIRAAYSIRTGTIWPTNRSGAVAWTACR